MIDTTMTANAARLVRFGLNLPFANSVTEIVDNARRASGIGFDVVLLGDHLGHFLEPLHLGSLRHARLLDGRRHPTRTALRHVKATEVGRGLTPKLIDELLRSELACLNQVVRERLEQASHG
jgi:hypothetical protein